MRIAPPESRVITLIYELPNAVESFQVFAFFPKDESDVKFSVSDDGKTFHEVTAQKEIYFHGAGEYGYWKPVLFHAEKMSGGNSLKIELTGETQIGRVEISHPASHNDPASRIGKIFRAGRRTPVRPYPAVLVRPRAGPRKTAAGWGGFRMISSPTARSRKA